MKLSSLAPFPAQSNPQEDFQVNIIIETPAKIRHKYAFDEKIGLFKLGTTIPEGLQWPYDYGFIPGTIGGDGDPLDALFLHDEPTFPGCFAEARLLGIIRLEKDGEENDRLVTCPKRIKGCALQSDVYETIDDLPKSTLQSICRFLVEYSEGGGHDVECKKVEGRNEALRALEQAIAAFQKERTG